MTTAKDNNNNWALVLGYIFLIIFNFSGNILIHDEEEDDDDDYEDYGPAPILTGTDGDKEFHPKYSVHRPYE